MLVLTTLLLGILILGAIHVHIRGRRGRILAKMPGPSGWPIIGVLPSVLVPIEKLWMVGRNMDKQYYPLYKFWLANHVIVAILNPDDAEVMLTSMQNIDKSSVYNFLHAWFGTGLLTSTGEKWQKRRKILTPAFHFNVLERYLTITVENSERAVKSLRGKGECVQDLVQFLTQHTLNIICEAAMGASLSRKEESQKKYRKAVHDMGSALVYRLVRPWLYSSWTFGCTAAGRMQTDALKILHRFTKNIIAERKEFHEKTDGRFLKNIVSKSSGADDDDEAVENEELHGYRKKRMAMLDLLIAAQRDGQQIDELGIREEVDTFMFEGHDTSAMGLCFALLLIAEHKDVQERIRQEVNEVLKNADGKLEMSELNKFNYLERVIKESLRLYPSVPFISRNITEDMQLKDYLIPRGTLVDVRIYLIHRDPKHWPDPLKFDPDRFLPERIQGRHPFSYIPFSAGPRNCIGQKFAMMELKVFVALIVKNFILEPIDFAHEVPILPDIVLRPARSVHVKFVPIAEK
ncbi:Cytochrome P450 9-like precursor [Nasonia vitripennis]|uniref:Cytochrome P450 n=1 Tax=Nasonia vitripennis TaxID=7425 RepID=A0A7M6UND0_NASVI|nr:Cytochrome P450 9-like precursor [Nasonia vitripennis]